MSNLIAIIAAYFLGAIPFGLIIPGLFGAGDIRKSGSGNIGATNAWRIAGAPAGILVMIFDIGKGVAAVLLAGIILLNYGGFEHLKLICGLAAIIGHVYSVFLRFKGGKGVNTALGVMIMLMPMESMAALVVFIITVVISRYISLGSMLAATAFALTAIVRWVFNLGDIKTVYLVSAILLNVLIFYAHRSNIRRLLAGKENRFSFRGGQDKNIRSINEHV
jgi:glycerol-3-phosphate acyltransferase PlsY